MVEFRKEALVGHFGENDYRVRLYVDNVAQMEMYFMLEEFDRYRTFSPRIDFLVEEDVKHIIAWKTLMRGNIVK